MAARAADSFTPAQRAEIVGIVRTALKADPSILRDAVGSMIDPVSSETLGPIVRRAMPQLRRCYEKELRSNPSLAGTIKVEFSISPSGQVGGVRDVSPIPFPSSATTACVLERFKGLHFPSHAGDVVRVTYPITFKAAQ